MDPALLNFLLTYAHYGFILWSFCWIIGKRYGSKGQFSIDVIDRAVVRIVAVLAMICLLYMIFDFVSARNDSTTREAYAYLFGPYWFGYWTMLFTSLILPQLFWIEKVRASIFFRIIAGLWMLCILNLERIIIIITSFHRDYAPNL